MMLLATATHHSVGHSGAPHYPAGGRRHSAPLRPRHRLLLCICWRFAGSTRGRSGGSCRQVLKKPDPDPYRVCDAYRLQQQGSPQTLLKQSLRRHFYPTAGLLGGPRVPREHTVPPWHCTHPTGHPSCACAFRISACRCLQHRATYCHGGAQHHHVQGSGWPHDCQQSILLCGLRPPAMKNALHLRSQTRSGRGK